MEDFPNKDLFDLSEAVGQLEVCLYALQPAESIQLMVLNGSLSNVDALKMAETYQKRIKEGADLGDEILKIASRIHLAGEIASELFRQAGNVIGKLRGYEKSWKAYQEMLSRPTEAVALHVADGVTVKAIALLVKALAKNGWLAKVPFTRDLPELFISPKGKRYGPTAFRDESLSPDRPSKAELSPEDQENEEKEEIFLKSFPKPPFQDRRKKTSADSINPPEEASKAP